MSTVVTAMLQEQFDAGLETRPDFTIDQPLERYTRVDHAVWSQLYARHLRWEETSWAHASRACARQGVRH